VRFTTADLCDEFGSLVRDRAELARVPVGVKAPLTPGEYLCADADGIIVAERDLLS